MASIKKPSEYFGKESNDFSDTNLKKLSGFTSRVPTSNSNNGLDIFESFKQVSEGLDEYFAKKNNDINVEKVDFLSEKVETLSKQLSEKLNKTDLENAMLSQLLVLDQSLDKIQNVVKEISEKSIFEVSSDVVNLRKKLNHFIQEEFPSYKKIINENEIKSNNVIQKLEKNIENTFTNINEFLDNKYNEIIADIEIVNQNAVSQVFEEFKSLNFLVNKFTDEELPKFTEYTQSKLNIFGQQIQNLSKKIDLIDEKKNTLIVRVDQKIEEVKDLKQTVIERVNEKIEEVKDLKDSVVEQIKNNEVYKEKLEKKVSDLEVNIIKNEYHLKDIGKFDNKLNILQKDFIKNENQLENVEKYIQKNHADLVSLREQLFEEIGKLPIGDIQENIIKFERKFNYIDSVYKNIKPENLVKDVLKESLLSEPSGTKNSDPLTPLDKNFVTLDQLQEHYRLFINRIQQQLSTLGGGGETRLKYLDDIVGISTNASFYNGKFLKYDHPNGIFVFDDVPFDNIEISEKNIIYVAKDGNDSNSGSLTNPKLTIKSAVEQSIPETVIRIAPGTYIEDNPIVLPNNVTVMGHSLRETTIIPQNDNKDLFHIGNGNYIAEMSFRGSLPNKSIFAFDPVNQRYIDQSPYIQNCTNFIPDSIGMKIDGKDAIGPLKSMVLDSYTQYNQGGIGVSITNEAYAQLVSLFTICNDVAVYCGSGGACDLTNSNSSFGNYGLVADGLSTRKYSGIVASPSVENSDTFVLDLSTPVFGVVNAEYNNVTGRLKVITDQPHKFNVGMAVSIVGLGFTCPFENGIRYYPNPSPEIGNSGYIFSVETVSPGRYLDAADLIESNKLEIQDKSLASVAIASTNFYFDEDEQTNLRSRYYDATRLIQKNKQEIVDKSLASIAVGFPSGFSFPGDANPKQRYYDASRLITLNKQEIVDKSLASIAIQHSDFYFPGDSQSNQRSRYFDSYRLIQNNRSIIIDKAWTDTVANYPDISYTQTKCKRDLGFFIDAISTDVFSGGNNYSRSFVLQYFQGTTPIGIASSERTATVYAFNRTRELMKQAITNTLSGAEYYDFTITTDPLTGDNDSPASCNNVQENISTLVQIVTTPIGAGNTSSLPLVPNYGYFDISAGIGSTSSPGGFKCARDISYLIESLATDVFTGGNKYSRDFTLQYFDSANNFAFLNGESTQSVTAFTAVREYAKKAITNQLNYKEVGISSGKASYAGAGTSIPVFPSGNANACTDVQNSIDTLIAIVNNVVSSGSTSYLSTFSENLGITTTNKCARDLGYLVEAISTDVFTGGNKYSRDFSLQYFDKNGNQITNGLVGEVAQSVYAFNALRDYAKKAVTNQLNRKNLFVSAGISSLGAGGPVIQVLPSGNPNSCTDVQSTINTLVGIVTSVIGVGNTTILSTFNENLGISTTNICARDLGLLIDSVSTDLFTGGNRYCREFSKFYFNNDQELIYINGENIQSTYAFETLREYSKKAITNQLNYKEVGISSGPSTYNGVGGNIPVLPSGSPTACIDVQHSINTLVGIVTNVVGPGNINFLNTFNQNSGIFANGQYKFHEDIGEIIDYIVEDLRGYTNGGIIEASKIYYNYDPKNESIVAFNAARDYMKLAINNQLLIRDFNILPDSITNSNYNVNSCTNIKDTINTEIEILTTAVFNQSTSSIPNTVSLASTMFTVDVGIATQPHYYYDGGTAKLNIIRPFDGQAVYFNELFYTVKNLKIINGGSGYIDAPSITIDPPSESSWGVAAQAVANIQNGVLVGIDMVSNGRGYKSPPNVTISSGINTAVAIAELVPEYYTIQKASEIIGDFSIITLNENVPYQVGVGTIVNFFKQSRVLATGHSFEFIGSGTDIATCLPFSGGVPIDDNETDSRNGGLVVYSSTNQSGNFKIGDGVTINQNTGSISGNAYTKSLFSTMTPFILSLGGF